MNPTPSNSSQGPATPGAGELVVQNGRMSGARCPLSDTATLIGRAEGCDVRLAVDGVEPLHCMLLYTAAGLVLRDLGSSTGTLLNGEPVSTEVVGDGDQLTVGPFRFRLRLPRTRTSDEPVAREQLSGSNDPALQHDREELKRRKEALRAEAEAVAAQQQELAGERTRLAQHRSAVQDGTTVRPDQSAEELTQPDAEEVQRQEDALRAQVAALTVQQAALTQEEIRLEQRRLALQQQDEDFTGNLMEKRRRLEELENQVRQSHADLMEERSRLEKWKVALERREEQLAEEAETAGRRVANRDVAPRDKDALRVQAAAVAAQQAALTEEEGKLEQRRVALQRQEEQLAGHLDEKRRRLLELQDQVRQARASLRQERIDNEDRSGKMLRDLERSRRELVAGHQKIDVERKRLGALRRRLRQRWHRHWDLEHARLQRQQSQLAENRQALEQQTNKLQQEREALNQARLVFNGEAELGRRQLQVGWDQFREEQKQAQERLAAEQAQLRKRLRDVEQREAVLEETRRELNEQERLTDTNRLHLEEEAEGLEARIRNQRRNLAEQEAEAARLSLLLQGLRSQINQGGQTTTPSPVAQVSPPAPLPSPVDPNIEDESAARRLAALERLAGELADQRLHLAEQSRRLLQARASWEREHESSSTELAELARRLELREQALGERERAVETAAVPLRQTMEEIERRRAHLEAWQVRIAAREQEWSGERDRLLIQLRSREARIRHQSTGILDLRRRWLEHRRQEVSRLQAEFKNCEQLRARYMALWEECLGKRTALEQEQRALAEKALAMEQYRLEIVGRADNSAAADRRLERQRRRLAAISALAVRKLAEDRRALHAEAQRLAQRAQELAQYQASLVDRDAEFTTRKTVWEQEQRLVDNSNAKLRQELKSLHALRRHLEGQVAGLQNELERVVHALLDPPTGLDAPPRARAA